MSDIQSLCDVIEPFVEDSMERSNEIIAGLWKAGYQIVPRQPKIEMAVWEPDADRPGYLKLVRRKTVGEVYDELVAIVGREGPGHNEYLSLLPDSRDEEWPDGRIAVFSVVGDSEGDYVHVEVLTGNERRQMILGKTFDGRDESWAFARRCADILEELA